MGIETPWSGATANRSQMSQSDAAVVKGASGRVVLTCVGRGIIGLSHSLSLVNFAVHENQGRQCQEMMIQKRTNLTESDLDLTVWRYLKFAKFISLITYQSLWFSKLKILEDQFEGHIPVRTEEAMRQANQSWKKMFTSSEFHRQIDNWEKDNVDSGREMLVVNCWSLGEQESQKMWDGYVGSPEGVAIKSTVRKLATHVHVPNDPRISQIGRVEYIDFSTFTVGSYQAHQASERAFLKDRCKYAHEREIRLVTMSFKTTSCVRMDGQPYRAEECVGKDMNNFDNGGLYVKTDVKDLIGAMVLAPKAPEWFEQLVKRIAEISQLDASVERSQLEGV